MAERRHDMRNSPTASTATTFGIFEAKNRLSELVERAARGEEIVITRRGEQVARLMPPLAPDARDQARALATRIRRSRTGHPLGGEADGVSLKDLIEEGRR
jgi:prevent-host-death family protein